MKFNFFTIGILLGFLPNILGLDANLDLNSKIVLQMLITMIFFWLGFDSRQTSPASISKY